MGNEVVEEGEVEAEDKHFPLFGLPIVGPPGGGESVREIDLTWLKDLEEADAATNP